MNKFILNGGNLNVFNSVKLIKENYSLSVSKSAERKIRNSRKLVEHWIAKEEVIYGINTGFGEFKDVIINLFCGA